MSGDFKLSISELGQILSADEAFAITGHALIVQFPSDANLFPPEV